MKKAFETFSRGGIKFLAVETGSGVMVCDDGGNNYGAYFDRQSFEDFCKRNGGFVACRLGTCRVSVCSTFNS